MGADDFECLNLIVTVPIGSYDSPLPVMVYIHGGANVRGSGSTKVLDTSNLVRQSLLMNTPVIVVSLNYGVNYFGFGWVKSGNSGLHDLVNGFRWIKKHVAGFGGDPDQLTAVGQSAGSLSVDALLQGHQGPLFRRAIMQSGTVRAALQNVELSMTLYSRTFVSSVTSIRLGRIGRLRSKLCRSTRLLRRLQVPVLR